MVRLHFLNPKNTLFLLCDVQEAFRKVIPNYENFLQNTNKLLKAGKEFEIPLLVTEQYPEKLGKTASELDVCHAAGIFSKTLFSMLTPEVNDKIKELYNCNYPRDVVIFGLETHVCLEQTSIDLLNSNINVFIVADCVCSRLNQDRDLALARLRDGGCIITTSESIIFNLLRDKNNPKFNTIRKLVKDVSADMNISLTPLSKL